MEQREYNVEKKFYKKVYIYVWNFIAIILGVINANVWSKQECEMDFGLLSHFTNIHLSNLQWITKCHTYILVLEKKTSIFSTPIAISSM